MSSFWDTIAGRSSGGGVGVKSAKAFESLGSGCVSIPEEVKAIHAGNSSGWHDGAAKGSNIGQQIRDLSTETMGVGKTLRAAWSGKAADAAIGRLDALGYALDMTSGTFDANARNVKSQAEYFDHTQSRVQDVPDVPPDQALTQRGIPPWLVDTEAAVTEYNAKQQANTDLYNAYANHGTASGGSLSADYGKLDAFNAGTITVGSPATPPPAKSTTPGTTTGRHRAPDTTDPGTAHTVTPPGTATVPPGSTPPGDVPGGTVVPGAGQAPPDGTTTAGFTPSTPGGSWPGGVDQLVPPLPGGGTGSGNTTSPSPSPYPGGGLGYLDGPGTGSGAGGRLPGGAGSPGAGVPGSGRQTGVRGGLVEEPVRTGPAGSARAGGRVQSGPGAVGQAGRGGAKEEDAEHKRKYVLETELFSDEDRKNVDPVNGLPPVPPTIGA